jgi:hypothetical protein
MRLLRLSTLLVLGALAGCAERPVPISKAPPPPPPAPERPLVETPPPATVPEPPVPELRPGTEYTLAQSEEMLDEASPKGPGAPLSQEEAAAGEGEAEPAAPPAGPGEGPGMQTASATEEPLSDASHLVGLSQTDAGRLLVPPVERKEIPPSQVWTYRSDLCELKLFFYPEVGGTAFRALTYQIDDRGTNDANHHACLASLAKPHDG